MEMGRADRPAEGRGTGDGGETRKMQKEEGRGKNNGEQKREAWKEEQKNQGKKKWTGEIASGRDRTWPGLKELQLVGPGGGASSPSLMAVK